MNYKEKLKYKTIIKVVVVVTFDKRQFPLLLNVLFVESIN